MSGQLPDLRWAGPNVTPKTVAETANELAELVRFGEEAMDTIIAADALANAPTAIRSAAQDLATAYGKAAGLFAIGARMPPERMREQAAEYGAILAAVAVAEMRWVAALAEARTAWLYAALRRGDANGVRVGEEFSDDQEMR